MRDLSCRLLHVRLASKPRRQLGGEKLSRTKQGAPGANWWERDKSEIEAGGAKNKLLHLGCWRPGKRSSRGGMADANLADCLSSSTFDCAWPGGAGGGGTGMHRFRWRLPAAGLVSRKTKTTWLGMK